MPFTLDGEWFSSEQKKPLRITMCKRQGKIITLIHNIPLSHQKELLRLCKKTYACGGTLTDEGFELQGDHTTSCRHLIETYLSKQQHT